MFIFNFKNTKKFTFGFFALVILTPLFYFLLSLSVILNCSKYEILNYIFFPIDKIYDPKKKYMCELRNLSKNHEIIFLASSANLARKDQREKGISEYLSKKINKEILTISFGAGKPIIFKEFINKSFLIDYSNVKYVVVEFNYHLFSNLAVSDPEEEFLYDKIFSQVFYEPLNISKLIELNKIILYPSRIKENIKKNIKEYKTDADKYYYLYEDISKQKSRFEYIKELNSKILNIGARPIFYSTPINISNIKSAFDKKNKYAINSKQFNKGINKNIRTIKQFMKNSNILFLDLTQSIKNEDTFFESHKSNLHIDIEGREYVADEIYKFILAR